MNPDRRHGVRSIRLGQRNHVEHLGTLDRPVLLTCAQLDRRRIAQHPHQLLVRRRDLLGGGRRQKCPGHQDHARAAVYQRLGHQLTRGSLIEREASQR